MSDRSPEYIYRPLMRDLGSLRPADFEGATPPYVPTREAVLAVRPEMQANVSHARQVFAAIGDMDKAVLEYLDHNELRSGPDNSEYALKSKQDAELVLDWFDAVDDGSPLHVTTRGYDESQTGQPLHNIEYHNVSHLILRNVDGVYNLSKYAWKANDWRAIKAEVETHVEQYYFTRDEEGELSPVTSLRGSSGTSLVSPVYNEDIAKLKPDTWVALGPRLTEFKRMYTVQQRMATTLDLLGVLPPRVHPQSMIDDYRSSPSWKVRTEYEVPGPEGSIVVAGHGPRGAFDSSGRPIFNGVSFNASRTYGWVSAEANNWRISSSQSPRIGIDATIDVANAGLRALVLRASEFDQLLDPK